jgi:hypothetical protein
LLAQIAKDVLDHSMGQLQGVTKAENAARALQINASNNQVCHHGWRNAKIIQALGHRGGEGLNFGSHIVVLVRGERSTFSGYSLIFHPVCVVR